MAGSSNVMRDAGALSKSTFDLLVVGGGIHGLFAAWDAATRGLSVALVERGDYGSGLSFNHQRTVHGGLRALETFQFGKAIEQIAERRRWALMAPALVRPMPFFVPTYSGEPPSRLQLAVGLRLYDLLGYARNLGVPANLHLPPSQMLSVDEARRLFPGVREDDLTGGARWSDYQTIYPDRLNWLVALAARTAGATLVNHTAAIGAIRERGRLTGVRVQDQLTGSEQHVPARAVLFAAGPALAHLFDLFGLDDAPPPLVAAANILIDRPARSTAMAARGRSGRRLTAVPWGDRTLVGTFQSPSTVLADAPFPLHVREMLAEANAVFPWLSAQVTDVRLVHRGLVPASVDRGSADLLPESFIIRHSLRGVPGVVSLVGVKFTTARLAARRAIDAVVEDLGVQAAARELPPLPHGSCHPPGPDVVSAAARLGWPAATVDHLMGWYGAEAGSLVAYAETHRLTSTLEHSPCVEAEIAYAVDHADASRLSDAVLRRTWLGATGDPGDAALHRAAEIMGAKLGWTSEGRDREIADVRRRYAI
jgi:glycerol-3-phosphate dehydrogenase